MKMVDCFFKCVARLCDRYSFIRNTLFYGKLELRYLRLKIMLGNVKLTPDTDAIDFYAKNANRVDAVARILADEQSRKVYLGMIKFRQTYDKRDYPSYTSLKTEYFIREVTFDRDEVFVDCGAYDGDTMNAFVKRCPHYKHIIAFEPDIRNFAKLKHKHGNNPRMTLINAGVYDHDGNVHFDERGDVGSKIGDESDNGVTISVKAIDALDLPKITFLKMDIEGAELNALKGAEKTIVRDKPKLAICIYHSHDDMLRIAETIHALVPEYRLYIRQHGYYFPYVCETILYALMPSKEYV